MDAFQDLGMTGWCCQSTIKTTSFPGSLIFPGGGKMGDPGSKVAIKRNDWIKYSVSKGLSVEIHWNLQLLHSGQILIESGQAVNQAKKFQSGDWNQTAHYLW